MRTSQFVVRAMYAGALCLVVSGASFTAGAFAAPGTAAPNLPAAAARETAQVSGSSGVTVGSAAVRGSASASEGDVVRLAGPSDRATVTYSDGSTVNLVGPASLKLDQLRTDGRRVMLTEGTAQARILNVAMEIQSPFGPSLVLQDATASASVVSGRSVTFTKVGGEYARVYDGGRASELGGTPFVMNVGGSAPATAVPSATPRPSAGSQRPAVATGPAKATQAKPTSARDEAAKGVPVWDATAQTTESTEEGFFRLARDFASTTEVNSRRLGYVPVWPRGEFKVGPFRVLPYLREGVEYNSNHYRNHATGTTGKDTAHDASWTHVNEIGAKTDASFMGGRLRILGSVDAVWNVRYDETDDKGTANPLDDDIAKADTFELNSELGAAYQFESGMYIRGGVAYERRADPIDVEPTAEFQRTNRRGYATVGFNRDIFFGSKLRFEMGTSVRDVIGREDALDAVDRTEANYYIKASYPFWKETTRIFGRARYRQDERESSSINDGYTWGFDAGIEGTIPLAGGERRGLRGSVSLGFDSSLYDNATQGTGPTATTSDENRRNTNLAVNAVIQYIHSSKTSFDFRYLRTNTFGFHGNFQIVDRFDLSMNYVFNPALAGRVGVFAEYDDPSGRLQPQLAADGTDVVGAYPSTTRFGVGAGLRYKINDWLDWDGQFDFDRRNNRPTHYVNYRASTGLTIYLNALKPKADPQR